VVFTQLFANMGWSLDIVTETSNTLAFRLSAILLACSSEMPPSKLKLSGSVLQHRYSSIEEFDSNDRLSSFTLSATKQQVPRSSVGHDGTIFQKHLQRESELFGLIQIDGEGGIADSTGSVLRVRC
jgi:hypothetical protein